MPITCLTRCVLFASLCGAVAAQQEEEAVTRSQQQPPVHKAVVAEQAESTVAAITEPRLEPLINSRTPIHTALPDPEGGEYGTWGAGAYYKASFHGDFTFVPFLGGAYPHNQPFTWRTVSATVGGQMVTQLDDPQRHQEDYRYEYRYGDLVEAYDIRVDGVEQTFVLQRRPAAAGDLVVAGRITTDLEAAMAVDRHGELAFHDDRGNLILHYGAAYALDATGRKTDVLTSFDGQDIHLRVPAAWLADAAYPVTIDPLLTRECTAFWNTINPPTSTGTVLDVDIGRDDLANQVMVAYTRQVSATDEDLWIWLFTSDSPAYANRNMIFSDVTTSWGNDSPAIGFGGGAADDWVIAFIRRNVGGGGTQHGARYHLHASGDTAVSTAVSSISRPLGSSHGEVIDVGGVTSFASTSTVFVVYERDDPSSNREVWGRSIDLATNTQGAETLLDLSPVGLSYTRRRPNINQVSAGGSDGWVVGWQEFWDARGSVDDWDINLRRIDGSGSPTGSLSFPSNSTPDDTHQLTPQIEGASGRYSVGMATYTQLPLTKWTSQVGTDIYNQRFDWPVTSTSAVMTGLCELTEGLVSSLRWRITGAAHDTNSDSHWAFAFESTVSGTQYACTAGYDAGRIERLLAYTAGGNPKAFSGAVTFNDDASEFLFAYGTNEGGAVCGISTGTNHTVYVQRMEHLAEPAETLYGTGCGPGNIGAVGRNLAGQEGYAITLSGAAPSVPAQLFLGTAPAALPLSGIGMTGCFFNISVSTPYLVVPAVVTDRAGSARVSMNWTTCPTVACGTFYWQWVYFAPGLNPLGVAATRGLRVQVICP